MAVGTYALTSLSNLKSWLKITASTDDAVLEKAIDRATARIESYTGRLLKARNVQEWRNGAPIHAFRLYQWPVISIANVWTGSYAALVVGGTSPYLRLSVSVRQEGGDPAVILNSTTSAGVSATTTIDFDTYPTTSDVRDQIAAVGGYTCTLGKNLRSAQLRPRAGGDTISNPQSVTLYAADIASEYTYDADSALLMIDRSAFEHWEYGAGRFPTGSKAICVEYRAGYETIPDDLEQACIEVAAALYQGRKKDRTVSQESLGDYSYTRGAAAEADAIMASLLMDYREVA